MKTLKLGSHGEDVKILQRKLNLIEDGSFGKLTLEAVKQFQKSHGLTVDGIVSTQTWTALGVISNNNPRNINKIIVHCTATHEGKDYTVKDIDTWHKARGFDQIGYHYVIYRDGSIHQGRPEYKIGAHTTGYNSSSIGVVYVGGLAADGKTPKDTRTPAQKEALIKLLTELKAKYPNATIHGHRDFAAKACPSFNATMEYKNI